MEQEQKNQTLAPGTLVRDEGVGGSNPLTPTMERAARLFQPAQAPAQNRYFYRPDTLLLEAKEEVEGREVASDAYTELTGYFIHERGRGHDNPLAFAYDVADAEKIVAALNRV